MSSWKIAGLWESSRELDPFDFRVAQWDGFDVDCWYCGVNTPTVRSVLQHMQRIQACDLSIPIILSETGVVMDGVHRLCKAWIEGRATVPAVQFMSNPPPDATIPLP